MKKLSFFIILFLSTSMYAGYFQSGDLWYYYSSSSSTTVSVAKAQNGTNYNGLTNVVIPETVEDNGKTYSVTSISDNAFSTCSSLTSVVIGNSVTSIGNYAFYNCSSLTSVTIPNSVTSIAGSAFYNCTSLTSITIPNSVTSIGSSVFYNCTSLTSITIPNSVTCISDNAFYNCSSLTSVVIGNSVTSIGNSVFYNCTSLTSITIPNSVTSICSNAFYDCTSLTSVTIPNSVTSIGYGAFSGCSSLTSVTWNAKACADFSTAPFSALTSIIFGEGTEHIPAYLCNVTNKIPTMTLPSSVKSIGSKAFTAVNFVHINATTPPALTSENIVNNAALIVVPDDALTSYKSADKWSVLAKQIVGRNNLKQREVTITANPSQSALHVALGESTLMNTVSLKVNGTINSYDIMLIRNKMLNLKYLDLSSAEVVTNEYEYYTGFCTHDNMLENYAFSELKLKVVHLPKNLVEIHDCFTSCKYLDTVYCQPGLHTIGKLTFDNCTSLRHIELKEGLVTIGENAFSETRNLQSIELPNSLETIGAGAFYNTGLLSLTIPANVSSIGQGAFVARYTDSYKVYLTSSNSYDSWYAGKYSYYYCGGGTLQEVIFAANSQLKSLPSYAFIGQVALRTIDWANSNITTINKGAIAYCKSLKIPQLPKKLKTIKEGAFSACSAIDTILLPPRLETIERYAFKDCSAVDVIKISSSVRNISNYAFTGCPSVSRVYTYTVEPTNILQQTFSCWHVASLYVPSTSYYNYYYNTQWSQFINLVEFDEEYDYFYLNGDYYLGGEYGEISGEPDIDLNPGSGLIIVGDKTIVVDDVTYTSDDDAYPSIITDDNLSIDTLHIIFPQSKGKWHFLTFPFDINRENIQCNSEFVVRYYDGQTRAQNGSGGWTNVPVGKKMYNGQGYIFQAASNDTLSLVFPKPKLPSADVSLPLYLYDAANAWDANWNMVGNPYLAYYDLDSIQGFTYPIITWNGTGYDTYRPGDDVYHFKPLEGFFIQNANLSQFTMPLSGRETRTQANTKLANSESSPKNIAAKHTEASRQLINLTLSDSAYTDRTRIVFNADASLEYEMGVDANKFISTSAPIQLYSLGKNGEQYSINERPTTASGEMIQLGYYAAYAGVFTLSASRMDTTITIYDNVTNQYVDLSQGDYMFSTEAGYNNTRFAMSAAKVPSSITNIEDINPDDLRSVSVYSLTGQPLAEDVDFSTLHLPAGVYVIQTNNHTYKSVIL